MGPNRPLYTFGEGHGPKCPPPPWTRRCLTACDVMYLHLPAYDVMSLRLTDGRVVSAAVRQVQPPVHAGQVHGAADAARTAGDAAGQTLPGHPDPGGDLVSDGRQPDVSGAISDQYGRCPVSDVDRGVASQNKSWGWTGKKQLKSTIKILEFQISPRI